MYSCTYSSCTVYYTIPSVTGWVHDAAHFSLNGHPLNIFEKYAFLSCFLTDCYSRQDNEYN